MYLLDFSEQISQNIPNLGRVISWLASLEAKASGFCQLNYKDNLSVGSRPKEFITAFALERLKLIVLCNIHSWIDNIDTP